MRCQALVTPNNLMILIFLVYCQLYKQASRGSSPKMIICNKGSQFWFLFINLSLYLYQPSHSGINSFDSISFLTFCFYRLILANMVGFIKHPSYCRVFFCFFFRLDAHLLHHKIERNKNRLIYFSLDGIFFLSRHQIVK